jgi:hypothetical protein
MARRFLAIAFVLAALAPEAFVSAQQGATPRTPPGTPRHSMPPNANHGHRSNPWANSLYINGGNPAQYLATSTPKPPPGKNKVNTGGQVFKSISN